MAPGENEFNTLALEGRHYVQPTMKQWGGYVPPLLG